MTKNDIIQAISKKVGLSKTQAADCLTVALEEITKSLSQGQELRFPGFGRFFVQERKEKEGINPKTKERITIAAKKVPRFKPGQVLKDAVR